METGGRDFVSLAETRSFSRVRRSCATSRSRRSRAASRRFGGVGGPGPGGPLVIPTRLTPPGEILPRRSRSSAIAGGALADARHQGGGPGHDRVRGAALAGASPSSALGDGPAPALRPSQEPARHAQRARRGDAPDRGHAATCCWSTTTLAAAAAPAPTATRCRAWATETLAFARPTTRRRAAVPAADRPGERCPTSATAAAPPPRPDGRARGPARAGPRRLDPVYETDMAEALKAMAIEATASPSCR